MTATAGSTDAWDRYWAYGNLHSFSQVAGGNYGGRIAAFWRDVFAGLADGSHVLDVATGNGAIPLLALEVATAAGRRFDIHGTDLAAIDPAAQVGDEALRERLRAIRFHARTPAEDLPFGAADFDLACSQFGLEYSDAGRSVDELARVLRPGGDLALIMHHERSATVEAARAEAAQADFVLDEVRLYARARSVLRAQAEAARRGAAAKAPRKKREALERAIARVERAAESDDNPRLLLGPLNYVHEVMTLAGRVGPARALEWLDEADRRVRATRERLAAMQAAARDEAAMAAFARDLAAAGFDTPDYAPLTEDDGNIVGWQVRTRRRV